MLEQRDHVIAYASRALTKSEFNYSVIQKECLAVVFGMKILPLSFRLLIHIAERLCTIPVAVSTKDARSSFSLGPGNSRVYSTFEIVYRKGNNADSLSRNPIQWQPQSLSL